MDKTMDDKLLYVDDYDNMINKNIPLLGLNHNDGKV